MAYATQLTIGTSSKVSLNYQSQQVEVSLTYELEREDTDVLSVVQEKAGEVAAARRVAWERIRDAKLSDVRQSPDAASPKGRSRSAPLEEQAKASVLSTPQASSPEISKAEHEPSTHGQQAALGALLAHVGWNDEQVLEQLTTRFGCSAIEQLTQRQAVEWLLELQRKEREKAQQRRQNASQLNGKLK